MKRICPYCQNSFVPKRIDAVYCCPSHKQMAYKERKKNLSVNIKPLDRSQLSKIDIEPSTEYLNYGDETLDKSIYPSIDGSTENKNPSRNADIKDYPSTKTIYPSTKDAQENKKPSTNNKDVTDYPSIDNSLQNQKPSINYPLIDVLQENKSQQQDQETEYKHYTSAFVDALTELTNERDNISKLDSLFWNDTTGIYLWVSIRFKCLVECLLTFSEMKTIELDDLKEICNAFTLLISSKYFISLPNIYPYKFEILTLRESIKKICQSESDNEPLRFRLRSQNKNNLIATRWELHYYVPKVNFSELNFKE